MKSVSLYFISGHPHTEQSLLFICVQLYSSTKRSHPYIVIQSGIIIEAIMNELQWL